jgi:hypothetical protein
VVGLIYFRRAPVTIQIIVILCGVWFTSELYCFTLRLYHLPNTHVSYVLTAVEIYFFSGFYMHACRHFKQVFKRLAFVGVPLVLIDLIVFQTPLNTFSLSVEYIGLTCYSLYLMYEMIIGDSSDKYATLNFTLLFYLLSSFPYFFAWEWLRVEDMDLLKTFALVHAYVHAACFLLLTYLIWRHSTLSFSARS